MKIKNIKHKKYPAFSFLEVVISIFIFALVILVATAIFSKVILARKNSRQIQNDVDTGKIALDIVAKNMQMSNELTCLSGSPSNCSELYFFNTSQGVCIKYKISGGNLSEARATPAPDCASPTYSGWTAMTPAGMTVSGRFMITPTDKTSLLKVIGRGTILLIVDGKYNLQTTVSFREYDGII